MQCSLYKATLSRAGKCKAKARLAFFKNLPQGSFCYFLVCDYYVHDACQEFAVPNCVEKATYDSSKSLSDARHGTAHHFQEGNLPNNSKCVKCKKTCWSPDSLTGMRCQWCGMSAHSSCLQNLPNSHGMCQFGLLEPIFLSPQSISIPRSQLTQDRSIAKSHAMMQARKWCFLCSIFKHQLDMHMKLVDFF